MDAIDNELAAWKEDEDDLEKWESKGLTGSDRRILFTHWLAKAAKQTLAGDAKWKYFEHTGALITAPHDLQPQPLDLGVHEESEDEHRVDEGAPGAEVLDANDDMDEDNEIPFEIPDASQRKH